MLRAGLVTVLLMGLGSTAMASDRVRVFVNYNAGGYYHVGHHYNERDCQDRRHWARRDNWNRDGYYRSAPRSYGYYNYYGRPPAYGWNSWNYAPRYSWGLRWDSGRDWDRGHQGHWDRGDHRDWGRDRDRDWDHGRDHDWDRGRDHDGDHGRDHDRHHH